MPIIPLFVRQWYDCFIYLDVHVRLARFPTCKVFFSRGVFAFFSGLLAVFYMRDNIDLMAALSR